MRPITFPSLATFLAIAAALTFSACGNKTSTIHTAETEGVYVDVGPLKYQVQISRQLNPQAIAEDKTMVEGIPAGETLGPDEVWFAVFLRVENGTDKPQVPNAQFEIEDQQGNVFEPVPLPDTNPFAWNTNPIRPGGHAPEPNSVAGQLGSIGGMLQLFKLSHATLQNRPLELKIKSTTPPDESTVSLDV